MAKKQKQPRPMPAWWKGTAEEWKQGEGAPPHGDSCPCDECNAFIARTQMGSD